VSLLRSLRFSVEGEKKESDMRKLMVASSGRAIVPLGSLALASAVLSGSGAVASGEAVPYIGVQFYFPIGGAFGTSPTEPLQPTDVAGQLPQSHYNAIATPTGAFYSQSGSGISLSDDSGYPTPVQLAYSSSSSWENGYGAETPNEELLQAELKTDGGSDTASITLSGVNAGVYDLLVYVANNDVTLVEGAYTVGTTTYYATESQGVSNSFTEADGTALSPATGNYVEFDNIVVPTDDGTIGLSWQGVSGGTNGSDVAAVNALQLVQVVPEPATASLFGLGGLFMLKRRSRRAPS
jgi:hypothetical protein